MESVKGLSAFSLPTTFAQRHPALIQRGIFFFPLVFILAVVLLKVLVKLMSMHEYYSRYNLYKWLIREDGVVESMTALVYAVSFGFALSLAIQLYRRVRLWGMLYFFLALGFLFICLEEISWGQRIFQAETPEFFLSHNHQSELNLHNMLGRYALHGAYILIGLYGSFASLTVPSRIALRYKATINLFVPPFSLFFYFFPIFALYVYYDYLSPVLVSIFGETFAWWEKGAHFIIDRDQEPAELLLSLGFLLFVFLNHYQQRKR